MAVLHISHQGAKLRLRSGRLVLVEESGAVLESVPARKVKKVVVHGNVGLTTPALVFLLRNGATVSFVGLNGRYYGSASPTAEISPHRIEKQLRLSAGDRLRLAREITIAKARSQLEYLRRSSGNTHALQEMKKSIAHMEAATDLEVLRGLEGIASRHYFGSLADKLGHLGYNGRRRRPPTDPVNAALSYGYAILLSLAATALKTAQLHTEIGIIHHTGRRRPALALDLMEEFRVAIVDVPVIRDFKRLVFKEADFDIGANKVLLNDSGKKKLIRAFENRLDFSPAGTSVTYREIVFGQADRLASAIVHGKSYKAYFLSRG